MTKPNQISNYTMISVVQVASESETKVTLLELRHKVVSCFTLHLFVCLRHAGPCQHRGYSVSSSSSYDNNNMNNGSSECFVFHRICELLLLLVLLREEGVRGRLRHATPAGHKNTHYTTYTNWRTFEEQIIEERLYAIILKLYFGILYTPFRQPCNALYSSCHTHSYRQGSGARKKNPQGAPKHARDAIKYHSLCFFPIGHSCHTVLTRTHHGPDPY